MLEFKHVSYETPDHKEIIRDVSLQIDDRFVAITGPNGSGKSTMAKLVAGIYVPTSGQILLDGEDITNLSITERAKRGVSFAFQQPVRFKGITVKELISIASGKNISVAEACSYLSEVGLCAKDYINREVDGSLSGHNTDYAGFSQSLSEYLLSERPRALVLGTGGASKAVQAVLADKGFDFLTVSHSGKGDLSYEQLTADIIATHHLIINTTPLGMHPSEDACPPIPYEHLTTEHYLFDLIYNPEVTEFLRRGQKEGAMIRNGQRMFVCQAEASWQIFCKI